MSLPHTNMVDRQQMMLVLHLINEPHFSDLEPDSRQQNSATPRSDWYTTSESTHLRTRDIIHDADT